MVNNKRLDRTFAALADPTRREMVRRLAAGDRTISELADGFTMSLPAVSKHVRVLERAGLMRVRREGRARRCTLRPVPMRDALAWLERYRTFWESSLDRLERYLQETGEEADEWHAQEPKSETGSASSERSRRRRSGSSGRGRKRKG